MKILFFTYDLPYPLNSGGKIRAYYLIKSLAKKHQITLFSFYRKEEQKKYLPEIDKFCHQIYLFWRRPVWSWQNFCLWFFSTLPFTSATYYSSVLKKSLLKLLSQEKFDLVHFESFYPALYLPLIKKLGIKTVMGNENLEYLVYQRLAEQKSTPLRQLLKLEVWKMRLFEKKLWGLADENIAISPTDATVIEKVTQKVCPVIPHGIDFNLFKNLKSDKESKTIIFIGTLIYQANADAIKYFLNEIYPKIKKQIKGVKFILVSWYKPDWLVKYLQDSSIIFILDKDTPASELLTKADIVVSPKRIASGINIKILEAMAMGLPVVTTSIGIEGIEAKNGKEVIVADESQDFANQVVKLMKNKIQREKLGMMGKDLVVEKYNWVKIAQKLEEVYQKLIYGPKS